MPSIERDENGIPYIRARSWLDALFGLGYVHAQDRASQVFFSYAVARGQAAEWIADQEELVETDRFFRRMGIHRHLDDEVERLEPEIFGQIQAYCDGFNEGIKAIGRSLPMWATGFQPLPWTPACVMLSGKLLSFGGLAVSQMQNERLLVELIHAGVNEAALRDLFSPHLDEADFTLIRQVIMPNQLSDSALELITDLPRLAGSNAWAVGPGRSATGHTILAADPHLEVNRLPAVWYEAVLEWDGGYVMGATLPGCPLFAVARTKDLAWGVTHMKGDTIDFFIEHCRPGGATGWQYRREDAWFDFLRREETIGRKAGEPETLAIYENELGTLDGELQGEGHYLAMNWTGHAPGSGAEALATWLRLVHAACALDGMTIARRCPEPTLCFVFADAHGHIAMQCGGCFPHRRRPTDGLLPLPAWDTAHHWQGFLDSRILPGVYDPPEEFVATANEEINPPHGPLLVTQILPDYRKRRIDQQLSQLRSATVQHMQKLQYDVVSLQAKELLEVFLPHMPDGPMKQQLASWDCRYMADSLEATVFQRLYVYVIMEVFGHDQAIGWRRALYLCTRAGYSAMILTAVDRVLKKDDSPWWRGRDKGQLIRRAAERLHGFRPVPWGKLNYFHFTNRFFGQHRVGRLLGFESRRVPMVGCQATVFQGHVLQTATRESTFAPSYHFVTDMGTSEAWTNLPGGPSESRFSRYYASDIARWRSGEYKRLAAATSQRAVHPPSTEIKLPVT